MTASEREELRRLMQASSTLYADEMPLTHTSLDELDLLRFRDFFRQQYDQEIDQLDDFAERSLSNLKLLKSPHLTLAGFSFSAKNHNRFDHS